MLASPYMKTEVVNMNKYCKEELEKKLKNKTFYWDAHAKLWRNVIDPNDCMTENQYQAIVIAIQLDSSPHP